MVELEEMATIYRMSVAVTEGAAGEAKTLVQVVQVGLVVTQEEGAAVVVQEPALAVPGELEAVAR